MQERPENFNDVDDESEATLVTPRFDADDARHAHPVVPLAEARPQVAYATTRTRRPVRRSWPPALLLVLLLAAAAVGGVVATKVLRRPNVTPAAVQAPAETAPNETTPTQTAEAPAPPAREDAPTTTAAPRDTRAQRTRDASVVAPPEAARGDVEDYNVDEDEDRRGHSKKKHHGRDEEDGEKELRKVFKHAKEKAPRLVDVLTNP